MQTTIRYIDVSEQLARSEQPVIVVETKRVGYLGSEFVLTDSEGGGKKWAENKSALLRVPLHAYRVPKDPLLTFMSAVDHAVPHLVTLTKRIGEANIRTVNYLAATQREDLGDVYRIYFGMFVGVRND